MRENVKNRWKPEHNCKECLQDLSGCRPSISTLKKPVANPVVCFERNVIETTRNQARHLTANHGESSFSSLGNSLKLMEIRRPAGVFRGFCFVLV